VESIIYYPTNQYLLVYRAKVLTEAFLFVGCFLGVFRMFMGKKKPDFQGRKSGQVFAILFGEELYAVGRI